MNLADAMPDDYMYYLLTTLNEEERQPIYCRFSIEYL